MKTRKNQLQFDAKASCILCAGVTGTGKSTFALKYLVARRDFQCRFLFDPEGEFSEKLGLPPVETEDEFTLAAEDGFVIFQPERMFQGDSMAALAWFSEKSFSVSSRLSGKKIALIDEVWKYCSPHSIPFALQNCINTGRKRGLDMIFAVQQPNRLNESIINAVSEFVCFRLFGKNALRVAEDAGFDAAEVAALPDGSFVATQPASGRFFRGNVFQYPRAKTVAEKTS